MKASAASAEVSELVRTALAQGHAVTISAVAPPRIVSPLPAVMICGPLFNLTQSEARILMELAKHGYVSRGDLHRAMSRGSRVASKPRTLDVAICRMRRKLALHGIAIVTAWGAGFRIDCCGRDKIHQLLADHGADIADAAPPTDQADHRKSAT